VTNTGPDHAATGEVEMTVDDDLVAQPAASNKAAARTANLCLTFPSRSVR
jgi:hypothetical protein